MISEDEFEERVILFLQYLDPKIVIGRLLGRAPKENTIFCNWGRSWWSIRDSIEEKMKEARGSAAFLALLAGDAHRRPRENLKPALPYRVTADLTKPVLALVETSMLCS